MSIEPGAPWTIFESSSGAHAVVVLNTPINFDERIAAKIVNIWNSALVRITVDGGTDRWLRWLDRSQVGGVQLPHMVTGDLDSIESRTLAHFRAVPECEVIPTMDQSQTDFTKALLELKKHSAQHSLAVPNVLVLCDLSGRFDQTIGNISTLYKACEFLAESSVYLLSATCLTWLLTPGVEHQIAIPHVLRDGNKSCGLLPIGGRCRVTTSGLKWNLNDETLELGKLVSSCNSYHVASDTVTIRTDNFLTWTMEIDSYLCYVSDGGRGTTPNSVTSTAAASCSHCTNTR